MATLDINVAQVNADFQAIKNKLVECGADITDGTRTSEYAPKIDAIYEAGQKAEYDRFWDNFQENGARTIYQYTFTGIYWNVNNFRPKYDIRGVGSGGMNYTFYDFGNSGKPMDLAQVLEDCGVVLDLSELTGAFYTFYYANVTRLPVLDLRKCTKFDSPLNRCEAVTIDKIILADDGSQNINGLFTWNQYCQNIVIEGRIGKSFTMQWNNSFTVESMQSFVDALMDLTGQEAQKMSLHSAVLSRLTVEQVEAIAAKNWTI